MYLHPILHIPGKSSITVIPADPAFIALNFTSIKIYWNTINNSIGKVNNYILNITQVDNNNEVKEIIDGTSESYVITNLVQGVKYSYTIIATDYNNRYGITSPSVEFIVDSKFLICCLFKLYHICIWIKQLFLLTRMCLTLLTMI